MIQVDLDTIFWCPRNYIEILIRIIAIHFLRDVSHVLGSITFSCKENGVILILRIHHDELSYKLYKLLGSIVHVVDIEVTEREASSNWLVNIQKIYYVTPRTFWSQANYIVIISRTSLCYLKWTILIK